MNEHDQYQQGAFNLTPPEMQTPEPTAIAPVVRPESQFHTLTSSSRRLGAGDFWPEYLWTWSYDPTHIPSIRIDKESRTRTGVGSPRSIAVARSVALCQRRDGTKSCHARLTVFVQTHVTQSTPVVINSESSETFTPRCSSIGGFETSGRIGTLA